MSDIVKNCDDCKLNECINCEHSWTDIQEIKTQLKEKDQEIAILKQTIKKLGDIALTQEIDDDDMDAVIEEWKESRCIEEIGLTSELIILYCYEQAEKELSDE